MADKPSPAAELRAASKLMRERAEAATPGPWERPLDTRRRNLVGAALPEGETGHFDHGLVPDYMTSGYLGRYRGQRERTCVVLCETRSDGSFSRKRSGRDLEHIASWHPGVALAVAGWLEATAKQADEFLTLDTPEGPCCAEPSYCGGHDEAWSCDRCGEFMSGGGCTCWDAALAVVRAYLQGGTG